MKDCRKCKNCDHIRGFICICHYSYDDDKGHYQVGQVVHRSRANICDKFTEQAYDRDKIFII